MSRCPGCGGIIGRDCFNPQECVNIGHAIEEDQLRRHEALGRIDELQAENEGLKAQRQNDMVLAQAQEKELSALRESLEKLKAENDGLKKEMGRL